MISRALPALMCVVLLLTGCSAPPPLSDDVLAVAEQLLTSVHALEGDIAGTTPEDAPRWADTELVADQITDDLLLPVTDAVETLTARVDDIPTGDDLLPLDQEIRDHLAGLDAHPSTVDLTADMVLSILDHIGARHDGRVTPRLRHNLPTDLWLIHAIAPNEAVRAVVLPFGDTSDPDHPANSEEAFAAMTTVGGIIDPIATRTRTALQDLIRSAVQQSGV